MSITQFAMVEELASLVKDNFSSRHLVLAVEEALVNYLQTDPSPDEILELEPMSSYDRLILHRLADIFGLAHESVGEGDDRHLVLQRCLETSIPSVLVSDIIWQHDGCESSPMPFQLLKRDDACTVLKMNLSHSSNIIDREAAYQAARERIFGMEEGENDSVRQKPRTDPAVARRMITHALGHRRNNPCNLVKEDNGGQPSAENNSLEIERRLKLGLDLSHETFTDTSVSLDTNVRSLRAKASNTNHSQPGRHTDKFSSKVVISKSPGNSVGPGEREGLGDSRISMREENFGAAKRMFAHALGIQNSKDTSRSRVVKSVAE